MPGGWLAEAFQSPVAPDKEKKDNPKILSDEVASKINELLRDVPDETLIRHLTGLNIPSWVSSPQPPPELAQWQEWCKDKSTAPVRRVLNRLFDTLRQSGFSTIGEIRSFHPSDYRLNIAEMKGYRPSEDTLNFLKLAFQADQPTIDNPT